MVRKEENITAEIMIFALLLAVLDLGALFSDESSWTTSSELFAVEHANEGFVFASKSRDIVNSLNHNTCVWRGLQVWEVKVYFDKQSDEEKIVRVELSLYNKGDAGADIMTKEELNENLAKIEQLLMPTDKKLAAAEKKVVPERMKLAGGSWKNRRVFARSSPPAELAWGVSSEVEYLRLTLMNPALNKPTRSRRTSREPVKPKYKDNLVKGSNGDVYIGNVPMVDQGRKGYCAAAVSERVLRYYGLTIDEHEIAQQAGTTAQGGTLTAETRKTVKAIGKRYGIGYQDVISLSSGTDWGDELARYNKIAKAEKEDKLELSQFVHDHVIEVGAMREAMKPKVLYRMRKKDSRLRKFLNGVRQQIDQGIPLFWGVTLGIFPEAGTNPQTRGGHMRLIIGYNDKKKEILYTDTWGEGHELKRMPEDWAFTITDDLFFLRPR